MHELIILICIAKGARSYILYMYYVMYYSLRLSPLSRAITSILWNLWSICYCLLRFHDENVIGGRRKWKWVHNNTISATWMKGWLSWQYLKKNEECSVLFSVYLKRGGRTMRIFVCAFRRISIADGSPGKNAVECSLFSFWFWSALAQLNSTAPFLLWNEYCEYYYFLFLHRNVELQISKAHSISMVCSAYPINSIIMYIICIIFE